MRQILKRLHFKLFLVTKTFGYTQDYLNVIYQIYLNHNKIIHFRDGYPVYSLSTPAVYSKSAANLFARSFFRSVQNKNLPNLVSFALNDDCNANCQHCSFYLSVDNKKRQVLSLAQCQEVIRQIQELGVSVISFVGGEPLLRKDLLQLLAKVDKNISTTIIFTNGLLLAQKAKELKNNGLDSVYVSVDYSDPKKHDLFRGRAGLFAKAIEGIDKAKRVGLSVGISSCLTPQSYKEGEFDRIVELGKKIGVHEVLIFDAMPVGRYKNRKDLFENAWVEDLIRDSQRYNQDKNYPGVLIYAYATSHRSAGCTCGTSYFYISPYGDVMLCDFYHKSFGNVLEEKLYKIWDRMSSTAEFNQAKWGGCRIKNSKYNKL